ncbi:hypothetical protein BLNAU_20302 [Blattamonas nauphoetae]|uniref:B30.2/SPRY domain-containing protein n=1 Tax=Blattamonas nauphoetae TaxID=2049346 RepID=A0ABQ9X0A1_9EUKA|nr:hypothetical protein BLNAU_20302 [Blattamonas nauphoetae]
MFTEPCQNLSTIDGKDETNHPTIESVLEWLSDSSVHPRNKVNSFQWFHIPTLLTTHIQSQPTKQDNEVLSQLLQRMMTILDECFDSHTPLPNKRLLHSSLSQLSQSPSLDPKIKRGASQCLTSLESIEEGRYVLVEIDILEAKLKKSETMKTSLYQDNLQLHAKLFESERKFAQLEQEKEQIQRECERLRGESEKRVTEMQRTMEGMRDQLDTCARWIESNDCIVAFSPDHFRVRGSTVTRINSDNSWAGCFTQPVSKGIHRLSIKTIGEFVMIGVCDAAEYPNYFKADVSDSPKAAMMNWKGYLISGRQYLAQNAEPKKGQELWVESDLEKRTLHFFIDSVQQPNHFINIPVPLVFAIDAGYFSKDVPIEITFWGELKKSNVTFPGTGIPLG